MPDPDHDLVDNNRPLLPKTTKRASRMEVEGGVNSFMMATAAKVDSSPAHKKNVRSIAGEKDNLPRPKRRLNWSFNNRSPRIIFLEKSTDNPRYQARTQREKE